MKDLPLFQQMFFDNFRGYVLIRMGFLSRMQTHLVQLGVPVVFVQ